MPPAAPKPGVIPLKPLTLGEILGGAMSTIGRYKGPVFGLTTAVFGAYLVVVCLAAVVAISAVSDSFTTLIDTLDQPSGPEPEWETIQPFVVAVVCVAAVALIGYVLAVSIVQAALLATLQEAVLGGPASIGSVWRQALPRVPALIGASILTGLIGMIPVLFVLFALVIGLVGASASAAGDSDGAVGAFLVFGVVAALLAVVPTVWLYVKFSLAPAAVVFEKQGPVGALRRSSRLVRGRWWPVFGISLLAALMAGVVAGVIQQILSMIGMFPAMAAASDLGDHPELSEILSVFSVYLVITLVGQLIGYLIQTTFPPLVNGLLYVDQRIRNENLAQVLAESAGLPPQPPGSF
ncbi:hypothetical protein AB0C77_32925 [Streptomyces sp. NPDC048629]|uniref:DUF7847 domain-containing protein n=1 Tax=Streptomyces sp. NPDC048629 TaxID=3154824 RepID=UPI003441BADD